MASEGKWSSPPSFVVSSLAALSSGSAVDDDWPLFFRCRDRRELDCRASKVWAVSNIDLSSSIGSSASSSSTTGRRVGGAGVAALGVLGVLGAGREGWNSASTGKKEKN